MYKYAELRQHTKRVGFRLSLFAVMVVYASGSPASQLEEIIVTAQKREEVTKDIPISISVISETLLDKKGLVNTEALLGMVPGLNGFVAAGSKGSVSMNMRGIGAGNSTNMSVDPVVGIYQDGVYLGRMAGAALDLAELERIEILRGPQGTLYGRNSSAGSINLITRKPSGEFRVKVKGTVGNYDEHSLKASVDFPEIDTSALGTVAMNVSAQARRRDPIYQSNRGSGFDSIDRQAYRVAARWVPTANLTVNYSHDRGKLDEQNTLEHVFGFTPLDAAGVVRRTDGIRGLIGHAGMLGGQVDADPRITSRWIPSMERTLAVYENRLTKGDGRPSRGAADHPPYYVNEGWGDTILIDWDVEDLGVFGDVTFKSITASRKMKSYAFGDLDDIDSTLDENGVGAMSDLVYFTMSQLYGSSGAANAGVDRLWGAIDDIGAYHGVQNTKSRYRQLSQEFQMVGKTRTLEYVLGAYYFDDKAVYNRRSIFAAPLSGRTVTYYTTTNESYALFAQATWYPVAFEERLALTGGLRFTTEDKTIHYDNPSYATPFAVVPAMALKKGKRFHNTSGNLSATYSLSEYTNIFIRYATGYRSGGFNGEVFNNAYDEETIKSLELGVKSEWWDRRARLNATVFGYDYKDIQVSQIGTSGATAITYIGNAGKAKRWGGEIEFQIMPLTDLILTATYAYINGDFDESPQVCGTNIPIECISSKKSAKRTSPGNQWAASADYVFARTTIGDLRGYLEANWREKWVASAVWTGVVQGTPTIFDNISLDERLLVNARITLENIKAGKGALAVSLWGNNLTNDDYPVFAVNWGALGMLSETYGNPRTYGLEVMYQY